MSKSHHEIVKAIILNNYEEPKTSLEPLMYTANEIVYKLFNKKEVICSIFLVNDEITIMSETWFNEKVICTNSVVFNILEFDGIITDEILGI